METFDQIKDIWNANQQAEASALNNAEMDAIIKSRVNKEKKGIAEYFWVAFVFQVQESDGFVDLTQRINSCIKHLHFFIRAWLFVAFSNLIDVPRQQVV